MMGMSFQLHQLQKSDGSGQRLVAARLILNKDVRAFAQLDYAQAVLDELPDGPTADKRGA